MTLVRTLVVLGSLAAAVGVLMRDVRAPEPPFLPHAIVLLVAVPLFALAAGIAMGGVRFVRSDERENPAPVPDREGWYGVPVFRPYRALRDASATTLAIVAVAGVFVFVDFFGHATRRTGWPCSPSWPGWCSWSVSPGRW